MSRPSHSRETPRGRETARIAPESHASLSETPNKDRDLLAVESHAVSRVSTSHAPIDVRVRLETPAGYHPIDIRYPHATVAGCGLHCSGCGAEARAPMLPRAPGYSGAVEAWLQQHRHCGGEAA